MELTLLPIEPSHDESVCNIIKAVGAEFGAVGEGFGPSDPEVEAMSAHYTKENKSKYIVALMGDKVVGGCGIAPFNNSDDVCELKKLFLLPEARGLNLGQRLTDQCLKAAQEYGFSRCYLDTLSNMNAAIKLYEKVGFEHLDSPLDGTLHGKCDVWMIKDL